MYLYGVMKLKFSRTCNEFQIDILYSRVIKIRYTRPSDFVCVCDCSANFSSQKLQVWRCVHRTTIAGWSTGTEEHPKGFRILLLLLSSSCNKSHFLACFYEYML